MWSVARLFHDLSIRWRIMLAAGAIVFLSVVLVVAMLVRTQNASLFDTARELDRLALDVRQRHGAVLRGQAEQELRADETVLRDKCAAQARMIAKLATVPLLTFERDPLNELCEQACLDRDALLCYIANAEGAIQTTFRNEPNPELARIVGHVGGLPVAELADTLRRSGRTLEMAADVRQDGQRIGQVVLLASRRGLLAKQAETTRAYEEIDRGFDTMIASMRGTIQQQARHEAHQALLYGLGAALLALLAGSAVSYVLSGGIAKQFRQTVGVLEAVAAGDLTRRLREDGGVELRRIAVAVNTAVDAQARTLAEVQNAKEAADAANEAKSRFLANMSHEIRTPLNGILGFTEVLLHSPVEPTEAERRDYLQTIRTSGRHLLALINDILDLSKIEAGRFDIECVRFSPYTMVAEVLSTMRVRASEKGIGLGARWPAGVPKTINSDPARLRQLLMNLVSNAIKFTATGEVLVLCRLLDQGNGPRLAFEVVDSGIGIPADKLEAIFDPFVQADTSITRRFGGTGLGLAISRRIAHALGGDLTVASELGKGSRFSATIPIGSLDDVPILAPFEADGLAARHDEPAPRPTKLPPAHVLVVDDGEVNRKLIGLLLRRVGLTVVEAENGEIAVERALAEPFDLVLMDMQMPVMDGYTATRRLRERGFDRPIIALTAHAMSGDEKKCRDAGCSGYLSKPVEPPRLFETLATLLEGVATASTSPTVESPANGSAIYSSLPADDVEMMAIVLEFVGELPDRAGELHALVQGNDRSMLRQRAHAMKGAAAMTGLAPLSQVAARLELAASDPSQSLSDLLAEIDTMVTQVQSAYPTANQRPQASPSEAN